MCAAGTHWWTLSITLRVPRAGCRVAIHGLQRLGACRRRPPQAEASAKAGRARSADGRILPDFLELFLQLELIPEVERHRGGRARRRGERLVDEAEQRAVEVLRHETGERGILRREDPIDELIVVEDGLHHVATCAGDLSA